MIILPLYLPRDPPMLLDISFLLQIFVRALSVQLNLMLQNFLSLMTVCFVLGSVKADPDTNQPNPGLQNLQ